jgi:hypothetical protein
VVWLGHGRAAYGARTDESNIGGRSVLTDAAAFDARWGTPMRPFLRSALVVVALGSSGCTFFAEIGGSSVVAGDQSGGTVSHVTTFTISGAMNMAGSWCAQYGLYAEEIRVNFSPDSMDFACVAPPRT